jgi:hypothetical protein
MTQLSAWSFPNNGIGKLALAVSYVELYGGSCAIEYDDAALMVPSVLESSGQGKRTGAKLTLFDLRNQRIQK